MRQVLSGTVVFTVLAFAGLAFADTYEVTPVGDPGDIRYFDSDVGIGTMTPQYILDIRGPYTIGNAGAGFMFDPGSTNNQNRLIKFGMNMGSGSTAGIQVWEGTTDQASVDSLLLQPTSGKVGIGTNSPSYTLDVDGTGRFTADLTVDDQLGVGAALSSPTLFENRIPRRV